MGNTGLALDRRHPSTEETMHLGDLPHFFLNIIPYKGGSMMTREVITVPNAPQRPFSPGIKAGGYIFTSGQAGVTNPETGEELKGIEAQTRQCLENIKRVLEIAGSSMDNVVKTTVFITDVADFSKMNEIYTTYFPQNPPARSTIVTGLVISSMVVEIECIAIAGLEQNLPPKPHVGSKKGGGGLPPF